MYELKTSINRIINHKFFLDLCKNFSSTTHINQRLEIGFKYIAKKIELSYSKKDNKFSFKNFKGQIFFITTNELETVFCDIFVPFDIYGSNEKKLPKPLINLIGMENPKKTFNIFKNMAKQYE